MTKKKKSCLPDTEGLQGSSSHTKPTHLDSLLFSIPETSVHRQHLVLFRIPKILCLPIFHQIAVLKHLQCSQQEIVFKHYFICSAVVRRVTYMPASPKFL